MSSIYHEKTFHVNSSSKNAKYFKFYGQKVKSTRNSNFGDYPGDIAQNLESPGLSGRVKQH